MAFFIIAGLILLGMQVIIGLWVYFSFPAAGWKIPALAAPLTLTLFMRWAMAYTRTHYGALESALYYAAYIWGGLVFILFSITMLFACAQGVCWLLRFNAKPVLVPLSWAVMFLAAASALYGGFASPKIKHVDVIIPGAQKMNVAVISDSHLGTGVSLARFQKALERINAQNPDAVFVLGDVFEYGMHRPKYAQALAELKTKYGSFGVLGNHEYYMGYGNAIDFYKKSDVEILQNQIRTLPNGLQLIGINDYKTARVTPQQLDKLFSGADPTQPRVLLSHQPLPADQAAAHGIPLTLSGHTHNGQIFPFNFFVRLTTPYVYGLYRTGEKSQIYVTSGMFYWGVPLRLLAPSEIPMIHIKGS